MLFVRPDFYDEFHCLAGACRHSCCVGWEIDIDAESLSRFRRIPGQMGELLRRSIAPEPSPHFLLTEDERCPLLREDGLCKLILACGEDSLCDICASHPRFYNEFPNRLEAGLGLCCEEAARLLTEAEGHLRLLAEDDGDGAPAPETALLRLRGEILEILAADALSLTARMEKALSLLGASLLPFSAADCARFFLTLERMDEQWTALLVSLVSAPEPVLEPQLRDPRYVRIAEYLVYRHFAVGPEEEAAVRLQFCFYALRLICALERLSPEALRLFSAEIEYSDENIEKICAWLDSTANA